MNHHKFSFLLSYVDMLYAVLCSVLALFMLTMLLISVNNPKKTGTVDTDAQVEIVMTWKPDGVANDIDLWVKPPQGVPIGYSHLQNTYMYLSRDDLGEANDYALINGKKEVIPGHVEVTSIRKKVPGHYVVNAEFYAIHVDFDPSHPDVGVPTPVTVTLIQINPYKVLATQTFVLEKQGDQHTAFSFDIDTFGNITNINTTDQVPFVFGDKGPGSTTLGGPPPQ